MGELKGGISGTDNLTRLDDPRGVGGLVVLVPLLVEVVVVVLVVIALLLLQ